MRLKFGVLGSLEVRGGDAVLPLRGAKQRLLLSVVFAACERGCLDRAARGHPLA